MSWSVHCNDTDFGSIMEVVVFCTIDWSGVAEVSCQNSKSLMSGFVLWPDQRSNFPLRSCEVWQFDVSLLVVLLIKYGCVQNERSTEANSDVGDCDRQGFLEIDFVTNFELRESYRDIDWLKCTTDETDCGRNKKARVDHHPSEAFSESERLGLFMENAGNWYWK